jgi:hypothetical protein
VIGEIMSRRQLSSERYSCEGKGRVAWCLEWRLIQDPWPEIMWPCVCCRGSRTRLHSSHRASGVRTGSDRVVYRDSRSCWIVRGRGVAEFVSDYVCSSINYFSAGMAGFPTALYNTSKGARTTHVLYFSIKIILNLISHLLSIFKSNFKCTSCPTTRGGHVTLDVSYYWCINQVVIKVNFQTTMVQGGISIAIQGEIYLFMNVE